MRTLLYTFSSILLLVTFSTVNAQYGRYDRHYDRGYGGRGYYNRGYYPGIGERVYLRRPSVYLSFGGYRYHYLDGVFYRPYGSYFEVVAPPVGIRVGVLPYGYSRLNVGPGLFYYFNGTYYRRYEDFYEVVAPPMGAAVSELPAGARQIMIDNKRLYEYNGTYYKEAQGDDGSVYYIVTGRNGNVYTENNGVAYANPETRPYNEVQPENTPEKKEEPQAAPRPIPHPGVEVSSLPEGSKTVIINNQKYFVSPDETYYQEQIDKNQLYYKVVAKPAEKN